MPPVHVNADNFARAETDRMFAALLRDAGSVNSWRHNRVPTPLDHQTVIRMNRDTLYSVAIVDLESDVVLTVPDAGDRYLSVMVVDQDHYIDRIVHDAGEHRLDPSAFGTRFVCLGARILADPGDPSDVQAVNALQDGLVITAGSAEPFAAPVYDAASLDSTRDALLELARGYGGFDRAFGSRAQVDPVRHLIGSAAGWGGLPGTEATYVNVDPGLPVGEYHVRVRDVPVDGFWSISLYNAEGYFDTDPAKPCSVNNLTASRDPDGAITVSFGGGSERPNWLPVGEGWNYLVRLYRPRPEVLDGSWSFPDVQPG